MRGGRAPFEPYHVARRQPRKADALIENARAAAIELADDAITELSAEARAVGARVLAAGVVLGGGWGLISLDDILASHTACHAAEGELYRDALAQACRKKRLAVTGVRERDLFASGAKAFRTSETVLRGRVGDLGRELGPPWAQDQKHAALVGWLALMAKEGGR
jgi:hypothetical protein